MEKLILNFSGYSEIDKDDLVVERIVEETGEMVQVDVSDMSPEEIIAKVKSGEVYINFERTYAQTLDGSIELDLEEDDEYVEL